MLTLKAIQQQSKQLISKSKDFILEHKLHSMLILILLCILLILFILMQFSSKKETSVDNSFPYEFNHSYMLPTEKEKDSYYFSRDVSDSWSNDEALQWFSEPDGILLDELKNKNTKKVTDILEAAP